MKQALVIVVAATVGRCIFALTCYQQTCVSSCDLQAAETCTTSYACMTTKMTMGGQEMITLSCASADCTSLLFNSSAIGLMAMTCCNTDRCNDGTNAPLEANLAYCYSASCSGEGCLQGMTDYIDTHDLGTFCAASEDGCQSTRTVTTNNVGEDVTVTETTGCAKARCIQTATLIDDDQAVLSYCCKDRLCNTGAEMTVDPNKEYCYAYTCVSSSCPSVTDAAEQGKMAYCEKTSDGCYVVLSTDRKMISFTHNLAVTGDATTIQSGCTGQTPETANCTAGSVTIGDLQTKSICCNSDRCNTGDHTVHPDKKYCYVYTCISSPCLSVTDAIAQGQTSLCEQSVKGCLFSNVTSSDGSIINAGCVGEGSQCQEMSLDIDGTQSLVSCCNSNLCNYGSADSGDGTPNGVQDYCHVYVCTSTTSPCTSLSEAIEQGQTSKCQRSDKGCYFSSVTSSNNSMVIAGCVEEQSQCTASSVEVAGTRTFMSCCNSNLCNNGSDDSGDGTPNGVQDYCHLYACTSTTSPCTSLSEAVEQGQTAKCQRSEKGCYFSSVTSLNGSAINAGCVEEQCTASSVEVAGTRTFMSCCNSNLCNNVSDDSGDGTPNAVQDYCHVYACTSTTSPCTSLSQAIEQGQTAKCQRSDKGCYFSSITSSNGSEVNAGCVEEQGQCTALSVEEAGTITFMSCCNSSLCNNGSGDSGDGTPGLQDYCHVYTCTSTTASSCVSLSEAIKQRQTTKCQRSDKGCYAMKSSDTTITAGCVGETSAVTECRATPPSGGTEVVCCQGNGCNDGFTSSSTPILYNKMGLFISSTTVLLLIIVGHL